MAIVDAILMELDQDQEAKITQRVLERVPEDKLAWKPHAKSSSLGKLAMHIARGQGYMAEVASKDIAEFTGATPPDPTSRKEILEAFAQSTAHAKETLAKMDDARLMATWTAKGNG